MGTARRGGPSRPCPRAGPLDDGPAQDGRPQRVAVRLSAAP